jgi:hypothetical protein
MKTKIDILTRVIKFVPVYIKRYKGKGQQHSYLLCINCRLLYECDFSFCSIEDCQNGFEPIR